MRNISRNLLPLMVTLSLLGLACSANKTTAPATTPPTSSSSWVYFDRTLYFSKGSSVNPEDSAAQAVVQNALTSLQQSTDLGADYFVFKYDDDSILQPVTTNTSYNGRNWESFFQLWDDATFNNFIAGAVGTAKDQDVAVAKNTNNPQQYYVVARLSCFVAGESCGYATQAQAQALVWRAFGYLVGMRNSDQASSPIMKPGESNDQTTSEAQKKYASEFNNTLERIRNKIPAPTGSNGTTATPASGVAATPAPAQAPTATGTLPDGAVAAPASAAPTSPSQAGN